jgi:predicted RNase H-like HicB family nuclease/DNA-binding XRE family transcriptional regulator
MPRTKPPGSRKEEAKRLLRLRQKLGLTQREMAQKFNSTPSAIALWETGDRTVAGPALRLIEIYEAGRPEIDVVLEPAEEGGFSVTVPTLSGCFSYGTTKEEALKNAKEAIRMYLTPVAKDLKSLKPGSIVKKVAL